MSNPTNPIAETVAALAGTGRRNIRDAALEVAANAYGPFTVAESVSLSKTEPKFSAWITGARGRNGFIIAGSMGKAIVGLTTLEAFANAGHVTNPEAFRASA